MVIQTISASNCTPQTIVIGRRGTYDTMQIAFDLSYLIENYGSGTAVLAVKRSQDESAYPAVVTQDGNILTWTITETDTYYVGSGECQLMWYVDEGLAKTIIYPMVVMKDILQTTEEPPDGYENWIEHLTELGAETQQNAQNAAQSASEAEQAKDDAVDAKEASEEAARKAAAASVHAPIIQNGFWYIWSDDQYVNTNVRAEGEKGDKGDTGEKGDTGNGIASITKTGTSGLVDTYTVTYTDGTSTTFTVTNGAKGDKGDTGATGNGIASIAKTGTSGNVDTYTITYTNGQTVTFTVTNGAVSSVAGKTGAVVLDSGDIGYDSTETYQSGTAGYALNDLNRHLNEFRDGFTNLNVFVYANLLSDSGYVAVADGKIIVNDNAVYSTYILPVDGVSKYTFTNCRFAVLVGSDKETAIGSVLSDVTQIQSTGAAYIAFSFNHNDYPVASYQASKGGTLETGYVLPNWYESDVAQKIADATDEIDQDINAVHDEVVDLKNALAVEVTESGTETLTTAGFSTGLMDLSGNVITGGSYDNYKYSASIPVVPGDVFRGVTFRFITAFSNGVAVSEGGGNSVSTYTVPDGIDAVVVSVSNSVTSFTHDYTRTVLKPIGSNSVSLDKNVFYKTGTFSIGGSYNFILMTQAKASISKRFLAVFECDCVNGTDFEFGFSVSGASPANARNNVITITSTKIIYNAVDYTHGITLEGRIKLIVEQLSEGNVKVTLMANGNSYSTTFSYELITTCSPYVMSDGLIANNCKLAFTCRDLQKKIWVFGDSYCSYNSARWRYYLHEYGYDENAFINAHSGAGSVNAITALNNLIKIGRPEYIVWAIGMNDGSDSNASTPASAWVTGRDSMLAICENYNITPIFCTIPNVPTVSNAGKNAWIKASGYKYIDLCHAVGADETTAWLGDMLSNDGVHPSVTGAKALFAQVVADFPEITINA